MSKQKVNKSKRIIWSSLIDEDDYREGYEDFLEANGLTESEYSLYDYAYESISDWKGDERINLNEPVGKIICIASLGLWNGRHDGYKIINCDKLGDALFEGIHGRGIDDAELYCDRYNVCGTQYHHDGTNYLTFRGIRNGVNIEKLENLIYNGQATSRDISRYTYSLRPMVAKVYGW